MMFCLNFYEYELTIYPMNDEDVIEIDSYQELQNYDNRY